MSRKAPPQAPQPATGSNHSAFHDDLYMQCCNGHGQAVALVYSRTNSILALSLLRDYVGAPPTALTIPKYDGALSVILLLVGVPRTRAMQCVGLVLYSPYHRMEWEARNPRHINHLQNFLNGDARAR